MLINSDAISTFDNSSVLPVVVPRPPSPGTPTLASPDAVEMLNLFPPTFSRPDGLLNDASAIRASSAVLPLENNPCTAPSAPMMNEFRVPAEKPFCELDAVAEGVA